MAKAMKAYISEMAGDEEPGLPAHLSDSHWKVGAPRCSEHGTHRHPHCLVGVLFFRESTRPSGFMKISELGEFSVCIQYSYRMS